MEKKRNVFLELDAQPWRKNPKQLTESTTEGVVNGNKVDIKKLKEAVGNLIETLTGKTPDEFVHDYDDRNFEELHLEEIIGCMRVLENPTPYRHYKKA